MNSAHRVWLLLSAVLGLALIGGMRARLVTWQVLS